MPPAKAVEFVTPTLQNFAGEIMFWGAGKALVETQAELKATRSELQSAKLVIERLEAELASAQGASLAKERE